MQSVNMFSGNSSGMHDEEEKKVELEQTKKCRGKTPNNSQLVQYVSQVKAKTKAANKSKAKQVSKGNYKSKSLYKSISISNWNLFLLP